MAARLWKCFFFPAGNGISFHEDADLGARLPRCIHQADIGAGRIPGGGDGRSGRTRERLLGAAVTAFRKASQYATAMQILALPAPLPISPVVRRRSRVQGLPGNIGRQ